MTERSWCPSRREFLRSSGAFAAALAVGHPPPAPRPPSAPPLADIQSLAKFVDPLKVPPLVAASGTRPCPDRSGRRIPYYRVPIRAVTTRIHRDLPPTRMWGYGRTSPGPTFETRRGQDLLVEWPNELPARHFLPIDHSVHGADADTPEVRTVTHLHGAKAPSGSDGFPEDWYVPGQSAMYYYPNDQDASMLWYHDHAMGITRLNIYAGLFGAFFVRDEVEAALNLPKGKYEIPLIVYDRTIDRHGQLHYPVSPDPEAPWVPEVFGDAVLLNGTLFPYLDVEPRKYRFRILNAANGRFFHLSLSNGQELHQIGTDLGLLPSPVATRSLALAPAERADVIVDFSGQAGAEIVLANDSLPVMKIRVAKAPSADDSALSAALRPVPRIPESAAVRTRILTLGQKEDRGGNPMMMLLNNAHWSMPVTETPALDSVEIWSFLNFTDDSHPIHLHLVRFQILDRRSFEPAAYYAGGRIQYIGAAQPPAAGEAGWKDTVQAHPGMVTRIIAKFEGYAGRYVWHCHILEHEDHEMMRPYDVVAAPHETGRR